ncbi:MAG: tyrosine-type recombinase/integrase [Hyphomicrobiaceae bacterium]
MIEAARIELRPDLWWAVALALDTGQRQGDCLAMRWNAIDAADRFTVKQEKTGKEVLVPIHRDLRAVLATIPHHAVTILTNTDGMPWRGGFQMNWNKHKPGLVRDRGLVFHELRKSAVVMLLEAGCTVAEASSITGQSYKMVEHDAAQVHRANLAASAVLKWENSS